MSDINNYININDRHEIKIKGVKDIISYDSKKIIFDMESSELIINGNDFNIKKLDVENKEAFISGTFVSMAFNENQSKINKSFFTSLFK